MTEPSSPALRLGEPTGRWVLLAAVLGSGLALLDATVVNIALPAIGGNLGASMAGLQWTVNAYTLTLAALLLQGGSLGDLRPAPGLPGRGGVVRRSVAA